MQKRNLGINVIDRVNDIVRFVPIMPGAQLHRRRILIEELVAAVKVRPWSNLL